MMSHTTGTLLGMFDDLDVVDLGVFSDIDGGDIFVDLGAVRGVGGDGYRICEWL